MFDRVICINLDDRPERWDGARRAWERFMPGRPLERFPASRVRVCGDPVVNGRAGCLLSHRRAIEAARRDGIERLLVLEDDVAFDDGAIDALDGVAWEIAFLGLEPRAPLFPVAPGVARVLHAATTHAIAYHRRVFDRLLAALPEEDRVFDWLAHHRAIDRFYAEEFLPRVRAYAVVPLVAHQRAGESDVECCELPAKVNRVSLAAWPRAQWVARRALWGVGRPWRWVRRKHRARRFRRIISAGGSASSTARRVAEDRAGRTRSAAGEIRGRSPER